MAGSLVFCDISPLAPVVVLIQKSIVNAFSPPKYQSVESGTVISSPVPSNKILELPNFVLAVLCLTSPTAVIVLALELLSVNVTPSSVVSE